MGVIKLVKKLQENSWNQFKEPKVLQIQGQKKKKTRLNQVQSQTVIIWSLFKNAENRRFLRIQLFLAKLSASYLGFN